MKALLIIDDDNTASIASFYLKPMGMDIIRYRDPIKALDNLEEIHPDAVIMSARDFPRHWKPIIVNVRTHCTKNECIVLLLKGEFFSFDEAAKAAYLGINGVLKEDLADRNELLRFQMLFKRYIEIDESRVSDRRPLAKWDKLDFVCSHPQSYAPLTGQIETISSSGISLIPDSPALFADLETGAVIEEASMKIDDCIFNFSCTLVRKGAVLAFGFKGMPDDKLAMLKEYLKSAPEREMNALLKGY